jgi:hypothetical protein
VRSAKCNKKSNYKLQILLLLVILTIDDAPRCIHQPIRGFEKIWIIDYHNLSYRTD